MELKKWIDERFPVEGIKRFFDTVTVPRHKHSSWYYWGGLVILFLMIQIVTGMLLSIHYHPSPDDAFASVQFIKDKIAFGGFIRSLHYFSAHGLILTTAVHLFSAFFMKAYRKPRELMWYSGLVLMVLLILSAFTGELLPWNELSYFGAVVGLSELEKFPIAGSWLAELARGGSRVTGETLNRAYSLHSVILPVFILAVLVLHSVLGHIFKLSTPPGAAVKSKPYRFYNEFANRMLIFSLIGLGVITIVSLFFQTPMGVPYDLANPSQAPAGIHPDWYFMWIYQLLSADSYFPSFLVSLVPLLVLLFLFLVPYIESKFSAGRAGNAMRNLGIVLILFLLFFTVRGYMISGISIPVFSEISPIATGGIGSAYFAAIISFCITFLVLLIYLRLPKLPEN